MKKIYIAEDDPSISGILKTHLKQNGYEIQCFPEGQSLLAGFNQSPCDLIITDIMMPVMNGYDLCREIRKSSLIPLIMISANNEEVDRILGLELGGDDYIGKPINLRELSIKVKNSLRRMEVIKQITLPRSSIAHLDLTLDLEERSATISGDLFDLTTKEFDFLELLIKNVGKAFSREQIIKQVWQYDFDGDTRQVDQLIKRLRKKMLLLGAECEIKTVWGFGYKIGGNDEK
ncbi:MAG: response regulator transcription factor [Eubacteriales bacterium]